MKQPSLSLVALGLSVLLGVGCVQSENAAPECCGRADTSVAGSDAALSFTRIDAEQLGYMEWGWWMLTIKADGSASVKYPGRSSPRTFQVSREWLRGFDRLLREASFVSMNDVYHHKGECMGATAGMKITVHNPKWTKTVFIREVSCLYLTEKERLDIRWFFDLWLLIDDALHADGYDYGTQVQPAPAFAREYEP